MTTLQKIYKGITKTAWGYFFISFNFSIGGFNLLPSFIGYLLFLSAITDLEEEERELSLLRTLAILLCVWNVGSSFTAMIGFSLDGQFQFLDIILDLVHLYFHFQLLTNLASIAARYQDGEDEIDKNLLGYRTTQTVMLTATTMLEMLAPRFGEFYTIILLIMVILYVIVSICIMANLFRLRRYLTEEETV